MPRVVQGNKSQRRKKDHQVCGDFSISIPAINTLEFPNHHVGHVLLLVVCVIVIDVLFSCTVWDAVERALQSCTARLAALEEAAKRIIEQSSHTLDLKPQGADRLGLEKKGREYASSIISTKEPLTLVAIMGGGYGNT